MNVRLKKIQKNDAGIIVKWRNENKQFFTPQPDFTIGSHNHWYVSTYLYDPTDHYYIVSADGTPVGTIAIDTETYQINRVLLGNKAFAYKGVMTGALSLVMMAHRSKFYWLEVLKDNDVAIAFYVRNGFAVSGKHDDRVVMELRVP